jgi:hypothetical protein
MALQYSSKTYYCALFTIIANGGILIIIGVQPIRLSFWQQGGEVGIEALLVLRDIRGLDQAEAEEVSRWVARSLLHASLAQAKTSPPLPPER